MKISLLCCAVFLLSCLSFAWDCPAGQIRQQAPAGTPTSTPYYDVVEGIAFVCVPTPGSTAPTGTSLSSVNTNSNTNNSSSNSNSNSSSTSSSNSSATANQKQKQQQSQIATGGNATSTATSTGGNAVGNGDNSNDSITNIAAPKIPVASAITPPIMPTVPCFKGYGGSAQTMAFGGSFGGGKVDHECEARELARSFSGPQTAASCKILLNTKDARAAGVTMEDCLRPVPVQVIAAVPPQAVPVPPPVVIVVPAPVVNIASPALPSPPQYRTEITVTAPKPVKKKHMAPQCQNGLELRCVAPEHQK
jgi:hypothetical protein